MMTEKMSLSALNNADNRALVEDLIRQVAYLGMHERNRRSPITSLFGPMGYQREMFCPSCCAMRPAYYPFCSTCMNLLRLRTPQLCRDLEKKVVRI